MIYGIGSADTVLGHDQIKETISPEACEKINLGYLDPSTVNPNNHRDPEDESILYAEKAGEILHRLKK